MVEPEDIVERSFGTVRRGFDPTEVRAYLAVVADDLRALEGRAAAAESAAADADATITRLTSLLAAADARVAALQDQVGPDVVADAEAEAEAVRTRIEAEGQREAERLVAEAEGARSRVLRDLRRRRKKARTQVEQLSAARERLLAALSDVRRQADQAIGDLRDALPEAKLAADAAARRVAEEDDVTVEQLENEIEALRLAGLSLVAPAGGVEGAAAAAVERRASETVKIVRPWRPEPEPLQPLDAPDPNETVRLVTTEDLEVAAAAAVEAEAVGEVVGVVVEPPMVVTVEVDDDGEPHRPAHAAPEPEVVDEVEVVEAVEPDEEPDRPPAHAAIDAEPEPGVEAPERPEAVGAPSEPDVAEPAAATEPSPESKVGALDVVAPEPEPGVIGPEPEVTESEPAGRPVVGVGVEPGPMPAVVEPEFVEPLPASGPVAAVGVEPGSVPAVEESPAVEPGFVEPLPASALVAGVGVEPGSVPVVEESAAIGPGLVERLPASGSVAGVGVEPGSVPVVEESAVVEPESVQSGSEPLEPGVVVAETPAPEAEAERPAPEAVDALFAKLKANRAERVAAAEAVLEQPELEPEPEPAAPPEPEPAGEDDVVVHRGGGASRADLLARRDEAIAPAVASLSRRVKRLLADDQNEVLDGLRRRGTNGALSADVEAGGQRNARWAAETAVDLAVAATAGVTYLNGTATPGPDPTPGDLVEVAEVFAERFVGSLHQRIAVVLDTNEGDSDTAGDVIRAVYRTWRNERLGSAVEDAVLDAFAAGISARCDPGTPVCWVVDDGGVPCPDAEDNALAGGVGCGQAFPTGHARPPAHPGCRCVLVPVSATTAVADPGAARPPR